MHFPLINLGALGEQATAPLPMPNGALYRPPNPDGTRKSCGNCVLWVSQEGRCLIHALDVPIESSDMCGYHVYGQPQTNAGTFPGIAPIDPALSGLRRAGPGVACASCKFFQGQGGDDGICMGVSDPSTRKPGVPVKSRGWCARYEGM